MQAVPPNERKRVLFLCTGNSCRSQMAEALLRRHAEPYFEALSAGLAPRPINPLTIETLEQVGISTEGLRPKPIGEFLAKQRIDIAIVVCAKAQESCPRFYPFAKEVLYWPFDDPALATGTEDEKLKVFRRVFEQIDTQITTWLTGLNVPFKR